jgi:hypothetical protein
MSMIRQEAEQKKIISSMKKYFKLSIFILFIACTNNKSQKLKCIYKSKYIDANPLLIEKSGVFTKLYFNFIKDKGETKLTRTFKAINVNQTSELIQAGDYQNLILDSVELPIFFLVDTSFVFVFDEKKYPEMLVPEHFNDWRYKIVKFNDEFKVTKSKVIDSTFKEEYFYNSKFEINRVNIFQGTDTLMFGN